MPTIDPDATTKDPRLKVVVGVIGNTDDEFLIQQRLPGTPCAGQWEFPGGKIESGENAGAALSRELAEELGIKVAEISPLCIIGHSYDHASVELDVYLVNKYFGSPGGAEGQKVIWRSVEAIRRMDVLEAVHPILDQL